MLHFGYIPLRGITGAVDESKHGTKLGGEPEPEPKPVTVIVTDCFRQVLAQVQPLAPEQLTAAY